MPFPLLLQADNVGQQACLKLAVAKVAILKKLEGEKKKVQIYADP